MDKNCVECSQPFQPKRREQIVCSLECRQRRAGKARKAPVSPCPTCGKLPEGGRARKFCSVACRAMAQRKPKICTICGTEFLAHRPTQATCSRQCAARAAMLKPRACEACGNGYQPDSSKSRFCSRQCAAKAMGLAKRKGPMRTLRGYVILYLPDHPMSNKQGYLLEHRKVMADVLGRMLLPSEVVHHKNEVKDDNRPENLEVLLKREHDRIRKPPPKPIECPHCHGMIGVSGRVRRVVAL